MNDLDNRIQADDASEDEPIELATDHACLLGSITAELARVAAAGVRGDALAERALQSLSALDRRHFEACCAPAYLALAPQRFDQELQVPIASSDEAQLDTRVLLWPATAKDGQHPHRDGWAIVMPVRGELAEFQRKHGEPQPERRPTLWQPALIMPEDGISHHMRNAGREVGLSVHVFGT
jgi:hypothetical protein